MLYVYIDIPSDTRIYVFSLYYQLQMFVWTCCMKKKTLFVFDIFLQTPLPTYYDIIRGI